MNKNTAVVVEKPRSDESDPFGQEFQEVIVCVVTDVEELEHVLRLVSGSDSRLPMWVIDDRKYILNSWSTQHIPVRIQDGLRHKRASEGVRIMTIDRTDGVNKAGFSLTPTDKGLARSHLE